MCVSIERIFLGAIQTSGVSLVVAGSPVHELGRTHAERRRCVADGVGHFVAIAGGPDANGVDLAWIRVFLARRRVGGSGRSTPPVVGDAIMVVMRRLAVGHPLLLSLGYSMVAACRDGGARYGLCAANTGVAHVSGGGRAARAIACGLGAQYHLV